jgi:hypothetical protein
MKWSNAVNVTISTMLLWTKSAILLGARMSTTFSMEKPLS